MTPPSILLASASPRRADLLSRLGLSFEVAPSEIPEDLLEWESPEEHAERLSREKATKGSERHPDSLVIAGDTVVVLGRRVLGKPESEDDAVSMLCSLA